MSSRPSMTALLGAACLRRAAPPAHCRSLDPGFLGTCGCCGRRIIGTMRALDETRGAVRVEDVYDTDIEDLWDTVGALERSIRMTSQGISVWRL